MDESVNLSAPWYVYRNELFNTFGKDIHVHVGNLEDVTNGFNLKIIVSNEKVAKALREVLPNLKSFGSINVYIIILDINGNVINNSNQLFTNTLLAETLCTALKYNPLFKGILIEDRVDSQHPIAGDVIVLIDKEIVQFFNDDISDICRNYNEVAAKVFNDLSVLTYTPDILLSYSTYDSKCLLGKTLYCSATKNTKCSTNCCCINKCKCNKRFC